ncbi:MAG: fasciclin domain-containing protein [Steroidobacteraceae bacterium]|jgi:uncharacterized surface protein with fasciclin (FAS1) repeats
MSTSNNELASTPAHAGVHRTAPMKNIVDTAIADGDFTTLVTSIKAAGLADTLSRNGPFTVFAPTDAAFRKLAIGALNALLKDTAKLKAILSYHIVQGYIAAKYLKSGEVATLQGSPLTSVVSPAGVKVNDANVERSDIAATNGVIHVIDAVILPKHWRLPTAAA